MQGGNGRFRADDRLVGFNGMEDQDDMIANRRVVWQ